VLTYIVVSQEVFLTDEHLCLVMDLADGGDLSSTIDRLRLQGVRPIRCAHAVHVLCDPIRLVWHHFRARNSR
jgi:hypothetical protein